jgi:PAS domain S-box-containing protein
VNSALRVLYTEDNAQDAELTRTHFSECAPDIEIEVVETGKKCLDWFTRGDCDLLLLDHHLPDMEGVDVLKALVLTNKHVPVVLVTGVGDESLVVKALRLGAASYVSKVGNYLATLPDLVRRVVENHRLKQNRGLLDSASRRILYVEHDSMDIALTLRHFAEVAPQFEIDVVHNCTDALARLAQSLSYDVALIALRMPDQSGLDFAREAQHLGLPLPPFIMISGRGDEMVAMASLRLGASDYVSKGEGYLDQLQYAIDHAIAHDRLGRLSEQLYTELVERKRVENEIRRQRATLNAILESSDCPIFSVDRSYHYTAFNRAHAGAMKAICGVEIQLGHSLTEYQPDSEAWPAIRKDLNRALRGESVLRSTSSGEEGPARQYFEVAHYPVRTDTGELIGASVFARNVTARKQAEDKRQKLEEQLRMAHKMEAIGAMAGGIAHDFNNLLSVILGSTDFAIAVAKGNDSLLEELRDVKQAGERAAVLTRQLLAFSRKQVLQPTSLDLNQVTAGVEKMLHRILGEDIDYVQVLAPNLGMVWADQGQIEQVIMNLVVNARDAMASGGTIVIETSCVDLDEAYASNHPSMKAGAHVQLAVTDTGSGMDLATQARIFEPFFTTKEQGKGTGLGLATVYGIVKQSGGDIVVHSTPGRGTTFKILLPQLLSAVAPRPSSNPVVTSMLATENILIVEDEESVLNIAKRILCAEGYTVLTASSGAEALLTSKAYRGSIHLLLTDVVMPRMSGKELSEHLETTRPEMRVLYMSGYPDNTIVHQGTMDPGIHFIAKPFSAEELTRKVREALDRILVNPVHGTGQELRLRPQ